MARSSCSLHAWFTASILIQSRSLREVSASSKDSLFILITINAAEFMATSMDDTVAVKWINWGGSLHMMTSSNGNIFRVTGPLCGESTGPGEFPTQRPVTRSFVVFFDLRLNKWLSKQPCGWWFETPSWSLWRHCDDILSRYKNDDVINRITWKSLHVDVFNFFSATVISFHSGYWN